MIHFCSENFYVFLLTNVLKALMKYEIEKNTDEEFYKKAGFKYKPDVITGMYLWIKK